MRLFQYSLERVFSPSNTLLARFEELEERGIDLTDAILAQSWRRSCEGCSVSASFLLEYVRVVSVSRVVLGRAERQADWASRSGAADVAQKRRALASLQE